MIDIAPLPLTAARFAPFGDVIEAQPDEPAAMNEARFERFDDLCNVDAGDGRIAVSIARCRTATTLPYCVDVVERHPRGSQAFDPLQRCRMLVLVAGAAEAPDTGDFEAFYTNGRQGINYHRGTWHMPLIAFSAGDEFLVIDRAAGRPNCDMHTLATPLMIGDI